MQKLTKKDSLCYTKKKAVIDTVQVFPDYYKDFSCIKGNCQHSCCVGWEIDIDEERINEYLSLGGTLGEKMKNSISFENTPHFCLDKEERCPFLNSDGLCELIIEKGQGILTTICKEHPRFYNERADRTECGLGLCCEEACRIIITKKTPMSLTCTERIPAQDEIIQKRDRILSVIGDSSYTVTEKQRLILSLLHCQKLPMSTKSLAEKMLELEMLDEQWGALLSKYLAKRQPKYTVRFEGYIQNRIYEFENLLAYLIYRHYIGGYDMEEADLRGIFALQICQLLFEIAGMGFSEKGKFETEEMLELCRLFSSEIEYSDENPEMLLDALYTHLQF